MKVRHISLFGGGHDSFKTIWEAGFAKPTAHALELFPLMNLEYKRRKHFEDLREKQVLIFAFNVYGPQNNLLHDPTVNEIAEKQNVNSSFSLKRITVLWYGV